MSQQVFPLWRVWAPTSHGAAGRWAPDAAGPPRKLGPFGPCRFGPGIATEHGHV